MALILVVDDEQDIRAALKAILEDGGHRVVEADDGQHVLDLALTHWPDLILLDHFMPKVPGLEALESLRAHPSGRDFPVIMVTAAGRPQDAQRARSLGVAEYISKPWTEGEITMRVNWALSRAKRPKRDPTERILAVDDEEHVRLALVSLLEDAGYEAAEVSSGEEVVEVAEAMRPDLILMDIRMPGVDGIEAMRRLKANPDTNRLPVIMVTAVQSPEDVRGAIALGACDYVVKPWHPRDLERRVRRALDTAALAKRPSSASAAG